MQPTCHFNQVFAVLVYTELLNIRNRTSTTIIQQGLATGIKECRDGTNAVPNGEAETSRHDTSITNDVLTCY